VDTSSAIMIALGLALVTGLLYAVVLYNRLVSLKHNVSKAWANIDVLLVQRHDELPKLVDVCREYMGYEQKTLEKVMQARAAVADARERRDLPALGRAEGALRLGLGGVYAVAENYPDLKADASFAHLQDRITALENAIADRREYYNESVNLNNVRIEQFPDVLIARRFGFGPFQLLEFDERRKADVRVRALFAT